MVQKLFQRRVFCKRPRYITYVIIKQQLARITYLKFTYTKQTKKQHFLHISGIIQMVFSNEILRHSRNLEEV